MKLNIRYTWDAVNDLDSIFDYISEDNRKAAGEMLWKIEKGILSLSDNPRMGAVVCIDNAFFEGIRYRKIFIKPYVVFYKIEIDEIYILRVLHSKQDWLHLLFDSEF